MADSERAPKPLATRIARWTRRGALASLGLLAGLAVAEIAFRLRDDGAFPHVNLYVSDAALGVRLRPGGTQRLKLRDNPTTEIRVNAQGYRGQDLPPPREDEILLVGDSQAFGLGVEEGETAAAQLATITGRPVVNAGVPTYGPLEYNAVARDMLQSRQIRTIVYVVNFANDPFEADRPNRERHAVWDGWAVRIETAPSEVVSFPGRELLMRRSHLVYALRRWLYERGPTLDDRGFLSEGTWTDLVSVGTDAAREHSAAERALMERELGRRTRLAKLQVALEDAEDRVDEAVYRVAADRLSEDEYLRYQAARGSPGDIVSNDAVEEGREIALTARIIRRGVVLRQRLLAQTLRRGNADAASAVAERDRLQAEAGRIRSEALDQPFVPSVLAPRLREIGELADANGAEVLIVALPLDVMVSTEEWAKYGHEPMDMEPTLVLLQDLVRTAERMGMRALDATEVLRAASPGAFLDHDIHMTPAGHRALAEGIARRLADPAPLVHPRPGLPDGRSRPPSPEEWLRTPEAIVRGSSRAGCETLHIREWIRVTCLRRGRSQPSGVDLLEGGHGEAMIISTREATTLVAPVLEGDELKADFHWTDRTQRLVVRIPVETPPEMYFDPPSGSGRPLAVSQRAARLCECHEQVVKEKECVVEQGWPTGECTPTCASLLGDPSDECFAAYGDDCGRLLRCVRGDQLTLPSCPKGHANAGATSQCFKLCSEEVPCADTQRCEPWQGTRICRPAT